MRIQRGSAHYALAPYVPGRFFAEGAAYPFATPSPRLPMRLDPRVLATVALVLASGCDVFTASEDDSGAGAVHFEYAGAYSGAFDAEGVRPIIDDAFVPFAGAAIEEATETRGPSYEVRYPYMRLQAFSPRARPRGDEISLFIKGAQRGTFTVVCGFSSSGGSLPPCAHVSFLLNRDPADSGREDATAPVFTLDSGSVTVKELTNDRVRGSFSGRFRQALPLVDDSVTIKVTDGRFNVPLRQIP